MKVTIRNLNSDDKSFRFNNKEMQFNEEIEITEEEYKALSMFEYLEIKKEPEPREALAELILQKTDLFNSIVNQVDSDEAAIMIYKEIQKETEQQWIR